MVSPKTPCPMCTPIAMLKVPIGDRLVILPSWRAKHKLNQPLILKTQHLTQLAFGKMLSLLCFSRSDNSLYLERELCELNNALKTF